MWECVLSGAQEGGHVGGTATWVEAAVNIVDFESELLSEILDAFNLHH